MCTTALSPPTTPCWGLNTGPPLCWTSMVPLNYPPKLKVYVLGAFSGSQQNGADSSEVFLYSPRQPKPSTTHIDILPSECKSITRFPWWFEEEWLPYIVWFPAVDCLGRIRVVWPCWRRRATGGGLWVFKSLSLPPAFGSGCKLSATASVRGLPAAMFSST